MRVQCPKGWDRLCLGSFFLASIRPWNTPKHNNIITILTLPNCSPSFIPSRSFQLDRNDPCITWSSHRVGDLCDAGLGLLPKSFTFKMLSVSYSAFGALLMRIIAMLQREAWLISGLNCLSRYSVTPYCIVVWSSNDTFTEADWRVQNLSLKCCESRQHQRYYCVKIEPKI
jgi:hypothetical protein